MADDYAEKMIADALQPLGHLDVPPVLRASIERQSSTLMSLASSLSRAGMDAADIRSVIDKALASYRDELVAAILTLREKHDPQ